MKEVIKRIEAQPSWVTILACAVCLAVSGNPIVVAPSSLFVVPMSQAFGWTRAEFFAGISACTMFGAAFLPFVGQAVDRWGPRGVILSGILAFGAAVAALSYLQGSWLHYLALMVVIGGASMLHGALPYSRVVLEAAGARRGLALAVAASGSTVGLIIVPPLCSELIARFGWRAAQMSLGAAVIVVALPTAMLFVGRRPLGAEDKRSQPVRTPAPPFPWRELRGRVFWSLGLAFLLNAIAVNAFLGHVAVIAVDHGLSMTFGALAVSLSGLGSAISRVAAGFMLDRFRSPQVGLVWFLLAFVGLIVATVDPGPASLIAAAILVGATLGAEVEIIAYFTSRFFPPDLFGRVYGLLFPFFMAGVSIGPLAFAMLFDAAGDYQLGFYIMAAVSLLGCLILTQVGPYRYGLDGKPLPGRTETAVFTAAAETGR